VFKATNHPNYAIEAFTLLVQEKFIFSPQMALQLKWNWTANTHGRPGKNIPGDLHLEDLNRECKNALSGLGSNITDKSVKQVGRCIGKTIDTLQAFDKANGIWISYLKVVQRGHEEVAQTTDRVIKGL